MLLIYYLNQENVINDEVTIFRGILNSSNALIADPIFLYKGKILPLSLKVGIIIATFI